MAEKALENALKSAGVKYTVAKGVGAFYGPKIEAHLTDSQGRDWQMGTAQLDLVMLPKQFDVHYADADGNQKMPWVIHRAIFGSVERFYGILVEHYGGAFPLWLAPVQARIATISEKQESRAREIHQDLLKEGFRVELDIRPEKIGYKIREAELEKIPYSLVIGDKEVQEKRVSVRARGRKDLGGKTLPEFVKMLRDEITESR